MDFSLFAISVPRAFTGTLLIAFVPSVKVSQRSFPIFFFFFFFFISKPHLSHSEELEDVSV